MTNETLPEYRAIILSAKAEWDSFSNEEATIEAMICECFNCHDSHISEDGSVWIAGSPGSSGEWLDIGSMAELVGWLRGRKFIAALPTPRPPETRRRYRVTITDTIVRSASVVVEAASERDAEIRAEDNAAWGRYGRYYWDQDQNVEACFGETEETDDEATPLDPPAATAG